MQVLPSVCPLDCPDRCALDVTVNDGRVVRIDGSKRSEYTNGYICSKVRRFPERQHSPHRVLHPMKRIGPKGSATFEAISWDNAIQLVTEKFTDVIRASGPEAVLPFHYEARRHSSASDGVWSEIAMGPMPFAPFFRCGRSWGGSVAAAAAS